ncbi:MULTISPECIES: sensor histidine kinase [Rhizobiaceae]|uniref:histidine kinase n=1 Tax=Aliirhizobium cellulosilyticum TaxID=393664 RepID=A0A7W6X9D5_9HYPH|nr:HAMP domain-containing sensor histidine kinase [Rhizobium cellulosilyticum]MBB4347752.1 two-component system cell cycle sensor histidine kinase PleC [Rhizobium cellulosilyticum]MBB4409854.1 two-component system cell cycle sensor histidine kinase PleC [Rhizobium cellulosilyticum]MBB4444541.1 two-component system cell cycle sensor histidine kinase PleC [Rhizobium cellulosilyticum]
MSSGVSISTDKIIVDRSRGHRNKAVSKTVRATRERLQLSNSGNQAFDRDMLAMHVNAVLQAAAVVPLFIALVTAIGMYISPSAHLIAWALLMLSLHAINLLLARRFSRKEIAAAETTKWRRRLLLAQILLGVGWATFALQSCDACGGDSFYFYKGAVLLFAISITAMSSFMLRQGVLVGFVPVIAALLFRVAISRDLLDIGLTAICAIAVVFFHFIGDRLYRSNLTLMSYQSEKDDLIAELEVAKSMSDEARRRAEEANLAKSRFLASMSHELRTPLNAILGFSEVMSSEVLGPMPNPTYREYAGDIHRSGEHLLNLINEILDLSRIEAGRYDLNEETLSLLEVAEDCIGMVQLRARAKNIAIRHNFENEMPHVWADEKSIRQVILNLLSNAVKFTQQGGEISVKVGWTAGGGQYVAIKDNGPGIPEEEIPVVLSAFGQGSIAIKSAEQGTGLGLPIVQAILAKHDGQFVLRSKLREGTEVIAILPATRVMQSIPAVADAPAIEKRKRSFA